MNRKELQKFKKTLKELSVREQLERLRRELKEKKNKEVFDFLQGMLKTTETKIEEKNQPRTERNIEDIAKRKEEPSLESKVEAEKPAFATEERIYGVKPSLYETTDFYDVKKSLESKPVSEENASIGFFKKMKEYESDALKPTEKYKRKEKIT